MKDLIKYIKEQIDYAGYPERMDPNTERTIGNPEKNVYGKSPAMPRGTLDVEKLASERFKKVVDKLRGAMGQPNLASQTAMQMISEAFMSSVHGAKAIENEHTEELEKLAIEVSLKATETPEGRYSIDAKLTGGEGKIPGQGFQFKEKPKPNFNDDGDEEDDEEGNEEGNEEGGQEEKMPDEDAFDVNNLTRDEQFELEVHKRNIINGIISGMGKRGHYVFQDPDVKEQLDNIDPLLYGYYLKVMAINDYFYFKVEDMIQRMSSDGNGIEGREDIKSKRAPKQKGGPVEPEPEAEPGQPTPPDFDITARGLLFPILTHEIIKAIEETLGRAGLSSNTNIHSAVFGQTDTLPNEAMQLRIGPELVERIRKNLPNEMFDERNHGVKPFFYKILYQIPPKPFLKIIANIVSDDQRDNNDSALKFKEIFAQAIALKKRYEQKDAVPKIKKPNDGGDIDDLLRNLGIGRAD